MGMFGQIIKTNQQVTLHQIVQDDVHAVIASFPAPDIEGYIIGRSDKSSTYLPDIDLSQYEAKKRGVSRRHAVLVNYNNVVHVMDLDSMNGTFINGTRIIPYEPHALRNGDKLTVADFDMIISE